MTTRSITIEHALSSLPTLILEAVKRVPRLAVLELRDDGAHLVRRSNFVAGSGSLSLRFSKIDDGVSRILLSPHRMGMNAPDPVPSPLEKAFVSALRIEAALVDSRKNSEH